jgi:hypothetical protein
VVNELDGGGGIPAEYKLVNRGSNGYRVELNVSFDAGLPADSVDAGLFTSRTTTQVNECLSSYGGQLTGPGGERLDIVLGNPSGPPVPPPITIGFDQSADARPNARTWSGSMVTTLPGSQVTAPNCATILHELLHRLGLVDEYEERATGHHIDPATGGLAYVEKGAEEGYLGSDCRARGPRDSVMAHQDEAVTRPQGAYRAFSCSCEGLASSQLSACRTALAGSSDSALECPKEVGGGGAGARISMPGVPAPTGPALAAYNAVTPGISADGNSRTFRSYTPPRSILDPAHFRAITQPGCASANRLLYTCSRAAYATSRAHAGSGCPRLPAACGTEGWLR